MSVSDFLLGKVTSRRGNENNYHIVMWGILVAAAILKLVFICNTIGSDDLRYFHFAERLLHGEAFDCLDHAASRIVFLILVGLPGAVFENIIYSSFASIAFAVATDILITLFVCRTIEVRAACITALFVSLSGISLNYSGILLPDTILAFFFCFAVIRLYLILSRGSKDIFVNAIMIGVSVGIAYSIKDTGILLLPPIVFCLLLIPSALSLRSRIFAISTIVAGFIVVFMAESSILYILSGDFLYRFHAISAVHNASIDEAISLYEFAKRGYWNLLHIYHNWDFLLIPVFLGSVATAFVVSRWKALSVFGIITLFCVSYMLFGSSSLTRLVNLPFQERYLQPLMPLVGLSVALLYQEMSQKFRLLVIITSLTAVCFAIYGSLNRSGERYFEGYLKSASIGVQVIHKTGGKVFADQRTREGLRQILTKESWQKVMPIPEVEDLRPGYYVLHPASRLNKERKNQLQSIPGTLTIQLDQRLMAKLFPQLAQKAKYRVDFRLIHDKLDQEASP